LLRRAQKAQIKPRLYPLLDERRGSGHQIAVFFGFDTYQEALAAQKRLQESGFQVRFWNKEEEKRFLAMALRRGRS
jgi:hypothetical protein